jgi:hypothetical protein
MGEYRRGLAERLRAIGPKAEAKRDEAADPYPLMVLRGGIEFNEWFADWCERMEASLRRPAGREERSS